MDDIRLEGKHLPLPPALNGTQWGQATMAKNLRRNCPSNNPCANVICPKYVYFYSASHNALKSRSLSRAFESRLWQVSTRETGDSHT